MSLLFSSHLLPDVEAVCEYVDGPGPRPVAGPGADRRAQAAAQRRVRAAGQGRPGGIRRPAGGAGHRRGAASTTISWCSSRGPIAQVLWERPARPASRSVPSGRGGARSKKSSSTPWREKTDADLRPGISALARQALGPGLALAADHPAGVLVQLKNRWVWLLLLGVCLPAFILSGFLVLWGLFEQKSRFLTPFSDVLPGSSGGASSRTPRLSDDHVDPGVPPVLRRPALLPDDPRAAGRARPDQPGPAVQRDARCTCRGRSGGSSTSWASWG